MRPTQLSRLLLLGALITAASATSASAQQYIRHHVHVTGTGVARRQLTVVNGPHMPLVPRWSISPVTGFVPRLAVPRVVAPVQVVRTAYSDINGSWDYGWGTVRISEYAGTFSATVYRDDGRLSYLRGARVGNSIRGNFSGDTGTGTFRLSVLSPYSIHGSAANQTTGSIGGVDFHR